MRDESWPPFAPVLLESMRAIGYSLETALADLIDNCISAEAKNVSIRLPPGKPDYIAILDDGVGMTLSELKEAMRHGSRNPREKRPTDDLGRFGLGLKTASLSQCRSLTVVSKKSNRLQAVCWDIDHVIETRDWSLRILDKEDIDELPVVDELRSLTSGTLVLWRELDRVSAGDPGDGSVLSEKLDLTRKHLALVFHRFLSRDGKPQIKLEINGNPIEPVDPFLSSHHSTIKQPVELISVLGSKVRVEAFTLPHISQLTKADIERAGGREDLRKEQGFYVYRNNRLIIWGTWFHLARQEELSKLTRVMVDVSNELDHEWTLDIKKSTAVPPVLLKKRLRDLVPRMCQPSKQAHQFRGRISSPTAKIQPVWERLEDRNGHVSYRLSREHPALVALLYSAQPSEANSLRAFMKLVEESFPGEAFYNDRAQERFGFRSPPKATAEEREHLEQLAMGILDVAGDDATARQNLLEVLHTIEPFNNHLEIVKELRLRLS